MALPVTKTEWQKPAKNEGQQLKDKQNLSIEVLCDTTVGRSDRMVIAVCME